MLPLLPLLQACKVGCLTGTDPECVVPSPCENVAFECGGGDAEVYLLEEGDPLPVSGPDALAAPGDVVLRNDRVVAVLDALDHPHYTAPTGGSLLDLAPVGGRDGLRNIFQATGLLPGDAVNYTEVRLLDTEDGVAAVQFRGALDGHPDIHVATRYEVRPCEPGVRIRTEVVNLEPDPYPLFLVDAFYWGGREALPFTPGAGFVHPEVGLTTLSDSLRDVPWMATGGHGDAAGSYGVASCDHPNLQGFQSREFSAMGTPKRILMPRDFEVFERFVGVADEQGVNGGADVAMTVRGQTLDAPTTTLSGTLVAEDGRGVGAIVRASLIVRDPDGGAATHAVPHEDGTFSARVPTGQRYTIEVQSYGQVVVETPPFEAKGAEVALDPIEVPAVGELVIDGAVDGATDELLVFVHPSAEGDVERLSGTLYENWDTCAPLLGHPFGPSPACNRVLVRGPTTVLVPPGTYDLYTSAGPFTTLARADHVVVEPGGSTPVTLEVTTLPLQPAGTLSADFHVHGRASFDSAIPDLDRVRSFLAARVQVVASTDHDLVNDYAEASRTLEADERLRLLIGTETTGHILFPLVETTIYPKVVGHFIFSPLPYDARGPWRGAPWDEVAEPGQLFDRAEDAGWLPSGVIQLNHPWGGVQFGRDYAWPQAIGLDTTLPLPTTYDGTGQGLFLRTPPGARHGNADFHAEEVMNGSNNALHQQYRAIWFYLLNEGVVRAGTANSDSHSLTDNVLGTPRTIVWSDTDLRSFDEPIFDRAVRDGRMIGTNGPVIEASLVGADGKVHTPSVRAFAPDPGADLEVKVSAAPWVPVDEVRIVVNGEVVKTLAPTVTPADPFGTEDLVRLEASIPLAELVSGDRDAWIVVEAGAPLVENADLDCNGVPDTGDNDGDGRIDWRDVEELEEDPGEGCLEVVGPFTEPPRPAWDTPGFFFERVTPGGHPSAFTNPLILDRDASGDYAGVAR